MVDPAGLAFAKLACHLVDHEIDGRMQIGLPIFRVDIRPGNGQMHFHAKSFVRLRLCVMEWMSESPSLLQGPMLDFLRPVQTVSHDRSDQSYERPLVLKRAQSG